MTVQVKICGLRDAAAVAAVVANGANYAGFVFYPPSPRAIEPSIAAALIAQLPPAVIPVGLFVDPTDDELVATLRLAPLRMIQLHGSETPQRVETVKQFTGLPVIKAVGIAAAQDIATAKQYEAVADMLLLDAKPQSGQLPGGNAARFDWSLLEKGGFAHSWMLAGGLTPDNVTEALAATKAPILDVSSGVEDAPGCKSPAKIKAFLENVRRFETCC